MKRTQHTPSTNAVEPRLTAAQLLDMASLDALGLLDESERKQFEDSFDAASSSVRAMVRDAQNLTAKHDAATLPKDDVSVSLRRRVIDRILAEIARERSAYAAPAARIHEPSTAAPNVAGHRRGVSAFWRAGAIGCMAAAVLFGVTSLQLWTDYDRLDKAIRTNTVAESFAREFGPRFETALLSPRTQFVQFNASEKVDGASNEKQATAVLLIDRDTGKGQFFARNLPLNQSFTLSIVTGDGEVRTAVVSFTPTQTREMAELTDIAFVNGAVFEITLNDKPFLTSASL